MENSVTMDLAIKATKKLQIKIKSINKVFQNSKKEISVCLKQVVKIKKKVIFIRKII